MNFEIPYSKEQVLKMYNDIQEAKKKGEYDKAMALQLELNSIYGANNFKNKEKNNMNNAYEDANTFKCSENWKGVSDEEKIDFTCDDCHNINISFSL